MKLRWYSKLHCKCLIFFLNNYSHLPYFNLPFLYFNTLKHVKGYFEYYFKGSIKEGCGQWCIWEHNFIPETLKAITKQPQIVSIALLIVDLDPGARCLYQLVSRTSLSRWQHPGKVTSGVWLPAPIRIKHKNNIQSFCCWYGVQPWNEGFQWI